MWTILLLLLVHIVRAEPVSAENNVGLDAQGGAMSPIDAELESMSNELKQEEQPAAEAPRAETPQAQAQPPNGPPVMEEDLSQSEKDVKRYVDVEPGEQIALVQYNVAPQIISTRPGDKIAILPLADGSGTPCPTTTTKSPHPRMYCQSCGKKNPKERGQITSYIDVDNSRECASLCARYISKGKECDVWEYHGEWRNKQCFLLSIPEFPKCKGDVGMMGDMSFESGTCYQAQEEDEEPKMIDELADADASASVEASVGNGLGAGAIGWKISLGMVIILIAGIALFRGRKRSSADYAKLLDNTDEV